MSKLAPCHQCQRHLRVDEVACPFCGNSVSTRSGRSPGRAAILAGALASATALGCGDAKPAVDDPSKKDQVNVVGESDAMAADPNDDQQHDHREHRKYDPDMPPMPYGAPPMRKRLV